MAIESLWRKKVTNSLSKTARWSALAMAMGILSTISLNAEAAVNWPGVKPDPDNPEPSKDYEDGYAKGKKDCVRDPIGCEVMLEDVVANPGWGETEPNDHINSADYLKQGIFYKGNSLDAFDKDWYFVETDKPNQNLVVSFMGDQADYTNTAGWIINIHDSNGNVIASFDSTSSGTGNVTRNEDQASLRSRERFWDIRVPKIDSIFDNSLVPRSSWSPGVPPQHRKLVAATHRSPI